jgi:flagellar basal body-associated protein FliL
MTSQPDEIKEPKKKKSKLLIICVIAFIAISAGTYLYFSGGHKNTAPQVSKENMKSVTLPSLTVNLADSGYVKTTITLEYVSSKKLENELANNLYEVKDSAIRVLRNTSAGSLKNPQSTENLKQALLKEVNSTLTSGKVTGLYFEEFIVQ